MKFNHSYFYKQRNQMDCGAACLKMILKYYGKYVSIETLRQLTETTREGASLSRISEAANKLGLKTLGLKLDSKKLFERAPLPAILHWENNHFVVLYKIKKNTIYIADPACGLVEYSKNDFLNYWAIEDHGIALLMERTSDFVTAEDEPAENKELNFRYILKYLRAHRRLVIQLFIGLFAGSLIQLIFPFLTQSVVDIGIQNMDMSFVYVILSAQLFLFIGSSSMHFIRSWLLLFLSTKINISIVSDFFIKLMKLPISYYDSKMNGDIMQRIKDHEKIENILTSDSLNVLFSFVNILLFSIVLAWYNIWIFNVFFLFTSCYIIWVLVFLKKREKYEHQKFQCESQEQSKIIELIGGMQDIKLYNAEQSKRWGWEEIKSKLFRVQTKALKIEQIQSFGAEFFNEIKNILITIIAAYLVINGKITLGVMLAISFILGQLSGPIAQIVKFMFSFQDARLALQRMNEIYQLKDEQLGDYKLSTIENFGDIEFKNVSFRYLGGHKTVLNSLNFIIPKNKVTAIVGASGSGKTTLLKLLLKFYKCSEGNVHLNNNDIENIPPDYWRSKCGIVMQDGFLFNDTIAGNIALGSDNIDWERLSDAARIANIHGFIEDLPQGFKTKIGNEGLSLSGGQKQRILIARAVYKEPEFIFFDEATSSLDANNEMEIMRNLNLFFKERTALVIAHRLSTVKSANQIIVLDNGSIVEQGTHDDLVNKKGLYYNLIKNQLELEN
jgi:ATP-binding cassette subfamily B protein